MSRRTYLDACLLIAAFRGQKHINERAMAILEDPERSLVLSDAVWLEVMPKPLYNKQDKETAFYEDIFRQAERLSWKMDVLDKAHALARQYGIAAMDAIHVATAIEARIDEFATAEKPDKPMFRVQEIRMHSVCARATL
ncbi:MAG: PIN domain-containing protein [Burkholderiaceae bacterium]|jgi:predicted nucleic acid-binding protein|nr:PIN domain-containing protein [Burkholderiaceae bacterium]